MLIFKALGVSLVCGLCGMYPGLCGHLAQAHSLCFGVAGYSAVKLSVGSKAHYIPKLPKFFQLCIQTSKMMTDVMTVPQMDHMQVKYPKINEAVQPAHS